MQLVLQQFINCVQTNMVRQIAFAAVLSLAVLLGAVVVGALANPTPLASCPRIVRRSEWRAVAARSTTTLPLRPAPFAVIHHTATGACSTPAACSTAVLNIQRFHMQTNGWADIGYNFLVGGDGQVYEGRGWGRQGAHAPGYNNQAMGIAFIGLFTQQLPTAAALQAAQQLILCGVQLGEVRAVHQVIGHRQGSATECPGQRLFDEVRRWPRWSATPRPFSAEALEAMMGGDETTRSAEAETEESAI